MRSRTLGLGLVLMALAGGLAAQQRPQGAQGAQGAQAAPGAATAANLTLVYEREVFMYRGGDRRDPFRPLTNDNEMGPRFENLQLRGIIYSTARRGSVALLGDGDGRVFRARVGDVVGNATVVEIGPLRVVMAVENFGTIRQEMLELQRNQGAIR